MDLETELAQAKDELNGAMSVSADLTHTTNEFLDKIEMQLSGIHTELHMLVVAYCKVNGVERVSYR